MQRGTRLYQLLLAAAFCEALAACSGLAHESLFWVIRGHSLLAVYHPSRNDLARCNKTHDSPLPRTHPPCIFDKASKMASAAL